MEWIAILWITGCSGLNCDPMVASTITQPDEATCRRVIETWRGITPKHRAVCTYGDIEHLNIVIQQTEDAFRRLALW